MPRALSDLEAAALPEVYLTVFLNVFQLGALPAGGRLLVHGGGSGIGTAAIQLAKLAGARVIVTAGSDDKCARCRALGADVAVNYRSDKFRDVVRADTEGAGVDVVLDSIGAPYLADNLASLAVPNVASGDLPGLDSLGIAPASVHAIAPSYLGERNARSQLLHLRQHARR